MSEDTNAKNVPDTEKMEVDSTVPDADAKSTENDDRTTTEKPEIKEELDGKISNSAEGKDTETPTGDGDTKGFEEPKADADVELHLIHLPHT